MSKHTPGPWAVGKKYPDSVHVVGNKSEGRYSFILCDLGGIYPEKAANAALIAAAPELLEALGVIASQLESHGDFSRGNSKVTYCYYTARNAIAKAEGKLDENN